MTRTSKFPNSKRTEAQAIPGVAGARSWALDVFPYIEQGNMVGGNAGFNLAINWWEQGDPVTETGIVMTQIRIMQCPSSPNSNRFQDKNDSPPRKKGACTDYFPTEGVNANINTELAALGQPAFPTGSLLGVLRPVPESPTAIEMISDGSSNTILIGECAGREDVLAGWQDDRGHGEQGRFRTALAPRAEPGPRMTTPTRSASENCGATAATRPYRFTRGR